MLTGAVELYDHPVVFVGSTAWPVLDFGDGPVCADEHHVAIHSRGQDGPVRVSFWRQAMPLAGEVVFDGQLDLADHTICVGGIEPYNRWIRRIGQAGRQRVVVGVDDPGHVSRIHIGLELSVGATTPPLSTVLALSPDELSTPHQRGLVLDGHDSPHARLTAAIRVRSVGEPYEISRIVEWLRWLGADLSFERAQALGAELADLVRAARDEGGRMADVSLERASEIARSILSQIR